MTLCARVPYLERASLVTALHFDVFGFWFGADDVIISRVEIKLLHEVGILQIH
jgi:hypothetical protein